MRSDIYFIVILNCWCLIFTMYFAVLFTSYWIFVLLIVMHPVDRCIVSYCSLEGSTVPKTNPKSEVKC